MFERFKHRCSSSVYCTIGCEADNQIAIWDAARTATHVVRMNSLMSSSEALVASMSKRMPLQKAIVEKPPPTTVHFDPRFFQALVIAGTVQKDKQKTVDPLLFQMTPYIEK